jgi:hypothetical protein
MFQLLEEAPRRAAEARRDDAIAKADPSWVAIAANVLQDWASCRAPFLAEDFIAEHLVSRPREPRHWGAVFKYAARRGYIRKVGYAPANSSNRSPKTLWEAA